jgi:hypothetical protein
MMHARRRFCISAVRDAEQLARMLTEHTWTLCAAFLVAAHPDYLFLNDATHEDGAGEYAVIKGSLVAIRHVQIESITFGWCGFDQALHLIRKALAGDMESSSWAIRSPCAVNRHELNCGQHAGQSGSPGTPQLPAPSNSGVPGRSGARPGPTCSIW